MNKLKKLIFTTVIALTLTQHVTPNSIPNLMLLQITSAFIGSLLGDEAVIYKRSWRAAKLTKQLLKQKKLSTELILNKNEQSWCNKIIERIEKQRSLPLGGTILLGPPGNGKTETIEYIAEKSKATLINIKPSLLFKPLGLEMSPVIVLKTIFEQAVKTQKSSKRPVVILLDEIDLIGTKRISTPQTDLKILIVELLSLIDMVINIPGIYVFAATNYFEELDDALIRAGRLGNHVKFNNPNPETIENILSQFIDNKEYIKQLSSELEGKSKSQIINYIRESAVICTINTQKHKHTELKELVQQAKANNKNLFYLTLKQVVTESKSETVL